ncbi:PTS transporter subunit EIIC [Vagococcus vulneris]|uniref:PTS beta-glucoside transporter subunit EIIBCA n=1 Tax=Vagococcus vulneris TaxID=1977869 RepID=A0A429ZYP1_9ENTE|nr:PTS transporter subunit EIIC [Vagococcus vulneris]RST99104.1 PTS beta-glucoside transporter subunit EIIBCA [Vagococcus vulneris]
MDYNRIAKEVIAAIGGKDNIENAAHCVTRLCLVLKDDTKYSKEELESIEGAKGVFFNSGQLQIIFGPGTVEKVFAAFQECAGIKEASLQDVKQSGTKKQNKLQQAFKVFSDIFVPIIPAFVGAAMILGLRALLTTHFGFLGGSMAENWMWAQDLARFFEVIATTFAYLPVLVMYSAVKRFGGSPVLGLVVGFVMVTPQLLDRGVYLAGEFDKLDVWHFFSFQIPQVGYQGGVFPAILTAWFLAQTEKFIKKKSPQTLSFILVPTVTIIVSAAALFLVFGPIGNMIGDGLGWVIDVLYNRAGIFGAFVFAAMLQPLTVTGTQHAIQGIEAQLVATTGFNYIQPLWSVSIIAQGGAAIGMYLLAKKNSKRREVALSSFIPTLVGISEPAIFAVNMRDSMVPFFSAAFSAGIGGAFMKLFDVKANGFALTVLPGLTISNPPTIIFYVIGNLISFILPIVILFVWNNSRGVKGAEVGRGKVLTNQ